MSGIDYASWTSEEKACKDDILILDDFRIDYEGFDEYLSKDKVVSRLHSISDSNIVSVTMYNVYYSALNGVISSLANYHGLSVEELEIGMMWHGYARESKEMEILGLLPIGKTKGGMGVINMRQKMMNHIPIPEPDLTSRLSVDTGWVCDLPRQKISINKNFKVNIKRFSVNLNFPQGDIAWLFFLRSLIESSYVIKNYGWIRNHELSIKRNLHYALEMQKQSLNNWLIKNSEELYKAYMVEVTNRIKNLSYSQQAINEMYPLLTTLRQWHKMKKGVCIYDYRREI